jgi:DSF synthase
MSAALHIVREANGHQPIVDGQTQLFDLAEMEVVLDENTNALWTYMAPNGPPNFSHAMLKDILKIQSEVKQLYSTKLENLKFLVLASRFPKVFNLGGDLALFAALIEKRDRRALEDYAEKCIQVFYRNHVTLDLPLVTIALIQGDALGGGFEAALSFNLIVAEKGVKMGLPETLYGLFPGMGAHAKLTRLLGEAQAERIIMSGITYTSDELYDMGIVHILAEPGEGAKAVAEYMQRASRRHGGYCKTYQAMREVSPLTYDELNRIVSLWVDAALGIDATSLKLMTRLANAQTKLVAETHLQLASGQA